MTRERKFGGVGGYSLTETLVTVCIIATLGSIAGLQYGEWSAKYNVEREIREMHADLLSARARALRLNKLHFVEFSGDQYTVYEDTYDGASGANTPDGDGKLQTTTPGDYVVLRKRTDKPIVGGPGPGMNGFYFSGRGYASLDGSIRVSSNVRADYDCIEISTTRLQLGKWDGTNCVY